MGGDSLRVKFNLSVRKVLGGDGVNLLVDPVDLAFKDRNSPEDEILVLRAIRLPDSST